MQRSIFYAAVALLFVFWCFFFSKTRLSFSVCILFAVCHVSAYSLAFTLPLSHYCYNFLTHSLNSLSLFPRLPLYYIWSASPFPLIISRFALLLRPSAHLIASYLSTSRAFLRAAIDFVSCFRLLAFSPSFPLLWVWERARNSGIVWRKCRRKKRWKKEHENKTNGFCNGFPHVWDLSILSMLKILFLQKCIFKKLVFYALFNSMS